MVRDQSDNLKTEYRKIREMWEHEDELVNHRLNWLLTSQTILFAGYATQKEEVNIRKLIALLGGLTSFILLLSIIAAVWALFILRKRSKGKDIYIGDGPLFLALLAHLDCHLFFLSLGCICCIYCFL
jgi:hypothetical protein